MRRIGEARNGADRQADTDRPTDRYAVTQSHTAMYGSLEPRDFKTNSKHDSKSKHDSLLTDLH